jgi:hypothetical protein
MPEQVGTEPNKTCTPPWMPISLSPEAGTSSINWAQLSMFYLKMETESSLWNVVFQKINRTVFLHKDRMIDNVQKHNICNNFSALNFNTKLHISINLCKSKFTTPGWWKACLKTHTCVHALNIAHSLYVLEWPALSICTLHFHCNKRNVFHTSDNP